MDIEKISQGAEKIQSNLLTNHPDLDSQVQQNFKNIIQTLRCIGDNNPLVREKKEIEFSNHLKDYQNLKGRIDEVTRKEFIRLMNDFMGELYKSVRWQDVYSFLFAVQQLQKMNELSVEQEKPYIEQALACLHHRENRIRETSSGLIAHFFLNEQYQPFITSQLIQYIRNNFVKYVPPGPEQIVSKQKHNPDYPYQFTTHPNIYTEAYVLCYSECLKLVLPKLNEEEVTQMLDILQMALSHVQKYIREASISMVCSICQKHPELLKKNINAYISFLHSGLCDPEPNVVLQSLHAMAELLRQKSIIDDKSIYETIQTQLGLDLFFNRCREATGVKAQAQNVWKTLFPENMGKIKAARMVPDIIKKSYDFCFSSKYEVRFMGCDAINILLNQIYTKITENQSENQQKIKAESPCLFEALLNCCFYETNVSVRKSAFEQMANLLDTCQLEIFGNAKLVEDLFECAWFHVPDQIDLVQEKSAKILAQICKQLPAYSVKTEAKFLSELVNIMDQKILCENIQLQPMQLEGYMIPNSSNLSYQVSQTQGDGMVGFITVVRFFAEAKVETLQLDKLFINFLDNLRKMNLQDCPQKKLKIWASITEYLKKLAELGKPGKQKIKQEEVLNQIFLAAFRQYQSSGADVQNLIAQLFKFLEQALGPSILKGRVESFQGGEFLQLYTQMTK